MVDVFFFLLQCIQFLFLAYSRIFHCKKYKIGNTIHENQLYSNPESLQYFPYNKKPKFCPPLILAVIKTVQHGFSKTGFYFKSKIIFSCQQTSNRVRKYLKIHSYSYYLHRTALCAAVSPPDDGPLKKTVQITIFGLETINLVQS